MAPIKKIKGTQDILPEETPKWMAFENIIRRQMQLFNYKELRTPIFETTELFSRSIGELTDIVSKEMYTFQDRSQKSITLKPEMTAPIMRAYLENNLQAKSPVNKIFYIAPMFRQENPQAGRLRQFNQYGAELIGSDAAEADAETISLALSIFKNLGLRNLELRVNSVGDPDCREPYKKTLQDFLRSAIKNPKDDLKQRIEKNPMRVLDSKDSELADIIQAAPKLINNLNEKSKRHYETVKTILTGQNISFAEDPTLVRGLDYYTHTVYEITTSSVGAQNALCGGGRYDLLAEQLSGKATPAVGFAAGMERILLALENQKRNIAHEEALDLFLISLGEKAVMTVQSWLTKLREAGFSTETDFLKRSIKAQFREANRQQARFVLILGENELANKVFSIKNMQTAQQQDVPFTDVVEFLQKAQ